MHSAIAEIEIGVCHRRELGDIDALARSIAEVGLLHPIVITKDGRLIAGERRLAACKKLGWETAPTTVVDIDVIIRGELAENFQRKDFKPSESVAIWDVVEPLAAMLLIASIVGAMLPYRRENLLLQIGELGLSQIFA